MTDIEKALSSARETKALEIGRNILDEVPHIFTDLFPGKDAVIVADVNTFAAAGARVCEEFEKAGTGQKEPYIFKESDLYAEYGYVKKLHDALSNHDAIPVAVGSGTINDLTKLAAHQTGRGYMCVATAASMDGYTAFGASVTADGKKQTFACPAPTACVADIEVIRRAPSEMTAAGYADLFAKVTAGADWIVAGAMGEEAVDKTSWDIVQGGLKDALGDPEGVSEADPEAITKLVNGLMLGGFAMQSHQSSRPASGAEHQFSHLWNMEHHTNHGESVSHGFQVAIGTLAVTALYEQAMKTPMEDLDVEACVAAWPDRAELTETAVEMFRRTDFPNIGIEEAVTKHISKERLRDQLVLLKKIWPELKKELSVQLVPFAELKRRLSVVGAPTEPEHIGISRRYLHDSFLRAQFIRRRYTVLDLAVRTNMLDKWLDGIFGPGGIWDLEKKTLTYNNGNL